MVLKKPSLAAFSLFRTVQLEMARDTAWEHREKEW